MDSEDDKLEVISGVAQAYLSEIPTVILGSGASVPLGLPTMKELGDHLLAEVEPITDADVGSWGQFKDAYSAINDLEKALDEVRLSDDLLAQVIERTESPREFRRLSGLSHTATAAGWSRLR